MKVHRILGIKLLHQKKTQQTGEHCLPIEIIIRKYSRNGEMAVKTFINLIKYTCPNLRSKVIAPKKKLYPRQTGEHCPSILKVIAPHCLIQAKVTRFYWVQN